ncbi:MAG: hypothetical protein IDH49_00740 [Gammaproteobacteria bacterium]|nr:hypothetical protein [Gammaproteobacteria bacterium]
MRILSRFAPVLLLGIASCACANGVVDKAGGLELTGALIEGGVECQLFQSNEGKKYTLLGNLKGFKNGDRVRIVGEKVEASFCMQGETLSVKAIESVK